MSDDLMSFAAKKRGQGPRFWRRRLAAAAILAVVGLIAVYLVWEAFFVYVPPGKHLVVIAKSGDPLPEGYVLAEPGQKGIQRRVEGEGWHFVLPIAYEAELGENTLIRPGQIGIVTARGGKKPPQGRLIAEEGERGIQRRVLTPGTYRINRYGYDVQVVDAVEIRAGHVGVQQRLLGTESAQRFAREDRDDEKGILRRVLQPGLYYINPHVLRIIPSEVGIFQTSFRYDENPAENTSIDFVSKAGFKISMDCTVEWEVQPNEMPLLVAEYGSRAAVERNVIDTQAHAIGRDKGVDYGVQNFLEGVKREEFQSDFARGLTEACEKKNVKVRSAFIRDIVIPEAYLEPIREKQIAVETELTNKAWEATRESEAGVERELQMVQQRVAAVVADTRRIVAGIERETENVATRNQAEIEKLNAEYQAKIASLAAQRIERLGQAQAEVTSLTETARSGLYKLKMEAFQSDGDAFLRYSLAEKLNPQIVLRLFQSGPGTFWTNLDGKTFNLMLPAGAAGGGPALVAPAVTAPAAAGSNSQRPTADRK